MIDKPKLRIDELYAYVSQNEEGEGLTARMLPNGQWMPLVCADRERYESLRPLVQMIANSSGKTIKLVRFSVRSEMETIQPRGPRHG